MSIKQTNGLSGGDREISGFPGWSRLSSEASGKVLVVVGNCIVFRVEKLKD